MTTFGQIMNLIPTVTFRIGRQAIQTLSFRMSNSIDDERSSDEVCWSDFCDDHFRAR